MWQDLTLIFGTGAVTGKRPARISRRLLKKLYKMNTPMKRNPTKATIKSPRVTYLVTYSHEQKLRTLLYNRQWPGVAIQGHVCSSATYHLLTRFWPIVNCEFHKAMALALTAALQV